MSVRIKPTILGWLALGVFATAAEPTTILCLGDSITAGGKGYPCYRQFLVPELEKQGLRFIGPNRDEVSAHAGYGGRNSSFLRDHIDAIYRQHPADIVLIHAAHNHFAKNHPLPVMLENTTSIVEDIHQQNPAVRILIAQVIPSGKLPKYAYLPEYNRALPELIKRLAGGGIKVTLVDQAAGFDWMTDTLDDKVHPNEAGARKMADAWLTALKPLLTTSRHGRAASPKRPVADALPR